jgi:hypothetical protein
MEMKRFVQTNVDRVVAVVLTAAGGVAIVVGWFGVSRTGLAAQQIPYVISGGLGGIALIAIGCTVWLSADLQDEWRRLDALDERLGELSTARAHAAAAADNGRTTPARTRRKVATEAGA